MSNVIQVPRPSKTAYNPHRPLEKNLLIKRQVEHFHHAEMQLPEALQTGMDIADVKTEGQAGEYIRKVTKAIHQSGGRGAEKVKTAR